MNLTEQINEDIKSAMKEKNKVKLASLRAIKSALLMAATEKGAESSEGAELKMLQKLVKQRRDAADIYVKEQRDDLAAEEMEQIAIIEKYLPAQMSEDQVKLEVDAVIQSTGASSMKDMGRVMGEVNKKLAGKADGAIIARLVKKSLN